MRPATGMTSSHELRNNLAAGSGRVIVNFDGGSDETNSWTLPVQVTAADFASLDKALALMPRRADGSLPDVPLMQLVAGSDLIDRGADVGLPFSGSAPDLGAYEFGRRDPALPADAGMPDPAMPRDPPDTQPPAGGAMSSPSGAAGTDATSMHAGNGAPAPAAQSGGSAYHVGRDASAVGSWLLWIVVRWFALRRRG